MYSPSAAPLTRRRATKGLDAKSDHALLISSVAAAEEAAKAADDVLCFWREREAAVKASLAKQQQMEVLLQQQLNTMHAAPNPADALLLSLEKTRKNLWEAKCSNTSVSRA